MAKPPSPVYCPQLSAAALVAFDFAVWRCCFACFVAVVLVVFLYVFSRRIFFHCCCCCCFGCNTRNSFLFTLSPGKTILSGPKSETCSQSRELPLYLSLSLSLLLPRMHCGFCCIIIMLRLHPLPPGLTPSPFHTPHWVRVDFVVDVVGKAFTLFVVMPGQKPLARLKAEITLVWAAFKSLRSEFI